MRGPTRGAWLGASFVLVLVCLSVFRINTGVLTETPETRDGGQYVALALGVARDGQFAWPGADAGELSMYREPFPVWIKAMQLRLDPRVRHLLEPDRNDSGSGTDARNLRQLNLVWAALLLVGVAEQVRLSLRGSARRKLFASVLAMSATHALLLEHPDFIDRTLSELPAAALVVWAGVTATRLVRTPRVPQSVLLGVLLGSLALTRASFLYVSGVFIVLLVSTHLLQSRGQPSRQKGILLSGSTVLVVFSLTVVPWIARNSNAFGVAAVSESSGLALHTRNLYNGADAVELRGMWFQFAPGPIQRGALGPLMGISDADFEEGGRLRRLMIPEFEPDDEPTSFYRQARKDRREMRAFVEEQFVRTGALAPFQVTAVADQFLLEESIKTLRERPSRLLRTTPVFLWRGVWVIDQSPVLPRALFAPFNLLGMLALLGVGFGAVFRRRLSDFAWVGLPVGAIVLNALTTIFEPRYTRVAVPTMVVLVTMCVMDLATKFSERLSGRQHTTATE